MTTIRMENFEKQSLEQPLFNLKEKMEVLNKNFKTNLMPEKGVYGMTEVIKENGLSERIGKNELGLTTKDYFRDGKIYMRREKYNDGSWLKTQFDDKGTPYLEKKSRLADNVAKENTTRLLPNTEIKKGNFTAITDDLGRPILNKIEDLELKNGASRESLHNVEKDNSYLENDHRGHLSPDSFGGPASLENVVAQFDKVNLGTMKEVENLVRRPKEEGKTVDYEMKVNYVGSDKRSSSFEPKITVDGKKHPLPKELRKIYNSEEPNAIGKIKVNIGEQQFGRTHKISKKSGIEAATITAAISTVDNVSEFIKGDIDAEDVAMNILKDTGTAGAIGYGSSFVTAQVAKTMVASSHELIQSLGKTGVPGAAIAFGIDSFDAVSNFAQGNSDCKELAYDLGDSAASVAGSLAGASLAGAALGSVVPGAGTAVGFAVGAVGGMVGYAIASEAYKSAIDLGEKGAEILADKAQDLAKGTVELVKENVPHKAAEVTSALNDFAHSNKLPFHL